MKWKDLQQSKNVEDRRGGSMSRPVGIGIGSVIVALIGIFFFNQNPIDAIGQVLGGAGQTAQVSSGPGLDDENKAFVSSVMGDLEKTWSDKLGNQFEPTKMVMFSGGTTSGCGTANASVGPFYCPRDQDIYLDTSFYNQLNEMTRGKFSDFAAAYVIAHEYGHHIQNLLGISDKVRAQQDRSSDAGANALSVRLELQADCFAGVWGNSAESRNPGLLDQNDIEGAIAAAQSIGDDTIQRQSGGFVNPESFTHGSSAQRTAWFTKGLQSGDPNVCNTFAQ